MKVMMLLFKDIHYDARVQREALALAEAGHQVTIACLEEYTHSPPVLHDNIRLIRCSISTKRIRRNVNMTADDRKKSWFRKLVFQIIRQPLFKLVKDVLASREYYIQIKKVLAQNPVVVIHCHDLNTLPAGYLLAKKFNLKLVYDSHELYNEMVGKNKIESAVGFWMEKRLIRHIDHLIVVNPQVQRIFQQRYGALPATVIQNTPILPDLDEMLPEPMNYWKDKYGLNDQDILLLYQGGLTPERGIEECIETMLILGDHYKLILLGDGRSKAKLVRMVRSLGLEERVFFHEQVPSEKILWFTKQADIGLVMYKNTCPNNYYSTPNKIFEYMMAGIPAVASDHPGKNYIVEQEQTGVCVQETPEAIKRGIESIVHNYSYYRNQCLQKRERFSWQVEKKQLIKLYDKLGERSDEEHSYGQPTFST